MILDEIGAVVRRSKAKVAALPAVSHIDDTQSFLRNYCYRFRCITGRKMHKRVIRLPPRFFPPSLSLPLTLSLSLSPCWTAPNCATSPWKLEQRRVQDVIFLPGPNFLPVSRGVPRCYRKSANPAQLSRHAGNDPCQIGGPRALVTLPLSPKRREQPRRFFRRYVNTHGGDSSPRLRNAMESLFIPPHLYVGLSRFLT